MRLFLCGLIVLSTSLVSFAGSEDCKNGACGVRRSVKIEKKVERTGPVRVLHRRGCHGIFHKTIERNRCGIFRGHCCG